MEYEIAGSDWEEERLILCPDCEVVQEFIVEGYRMEIWATCTVCNNQLDLSDDPGYFEDAA